MKKQNIQFITLTTIILAAAFSRVVPHMPNFSPMEAITLFAAAHFARRWQVFVIPFVAMWLSSLFIDNVIYAASNPQFVWMYSGFHWQYGSYVLIALLGIVTFRRGVSTGKIVASGLGSGLIFFLVSNFGVWLQDSLYSHDLAGLVACYAAAIPFYTGTFLGDAFYVTVLLGGYAFVQKKYPQLNSQTLNATT